MNFDLPTRPQVTYPVMLSDLVSIADTAGVLDGMRMFYVDRPDEQQHIINLVQQLRDIVARASEQQPVLIFANPDERQPHE